MPSQGSTSARGYGAAHQRERARWEPIVVAGDAWCWRCGLRIDPEEPWDLGHLRPGVYAGPEHASCNRRAPRTAGKRPPEPHPGRLKLSK